MHTAYFRFALPVLLITTILVLLSASASAQANSFHDGIAARGVPASVTSLGFGGHPGFHGVPASVISLGFGAHNGFSARPGFRGVPPSVTSFGVGGFHHGMHERPFGARRHHHHFSGFYSPFYGSYYVPYAYPSYLSNDDEYADDASAYESRGDYGPRGDDDRQTLNEDYRADLNSPREQQPQASPEPVAEQPSTLLIFKDGHQLEIANYAIVGATLYDLTDGRSKKVQLADLDLPATVKKNDERGVAFQLPAQTKLN